MAQVVKRRGTLRRRRTIKGFFFLAFFWLVNGLLAYQFFRGLWHWLDRAREAGFGDADAAKDARSLLTLVGVWVVMAAITGILAWLTRGRRETVTIDEIAR